MAAAMPGRCTTPKLLDKNCHPDGDPLKAGRRGTPIKLHHCWQNILPA